MYNVKKIEYIRLKPADNGHILSYTEKKKSSSGGDFGGLIHSENELVFNSVEDAMEAYVNIIKKAKMLESGNSMPNITIEIEKDSD